MLEEQCPTGKKCFPSWTAAERSMNYIRKHGNRKNSGTPSRAYRCEHCAWFHLTSQAERDEWWNEE